MKEFSIIHGDLFYLSLLVWCKIICMAALETQLSTLLPQVLMLLYNVYNCYCRKCHFFPAVKKHCFVGNALCQETLVHWCKNFNSIGCTVWHLKQDRYLFPQGYTVFILFSLVWSVTEVLCLFFLHAHCELVKTKLLIVFWYNEGIAEDVCSRQGCI